MKAFLLAFILLNVSCGPYMDLKKGIVSGGLMSKTDAFAGKVKLADGSSASWSIIGTDSTEVPKSIAATVATGITVSGLNKASDNKLAETNSNNAVKKNAADNVTKQKAIEAAATPVVTEPPQTVTFPPVQP